MIKGHCSTNIDRGKHERWPEKFVAVPSIGDRVEARSGASLKVVGITHTMVDIRDDHDGHIICSEPGIRVELNR